MPRPDVLVSFVAAAVYMNSLDGELLFDDEPAIVRNNDLRPSTPWRALLEHDFWGGAISFTTSNKSFRPLTTASFRLNFAFHGLDPWGYHAVNVLGHMLATFLFCSVASKLLLSSTAPTPAAASLAWCRATVAGLLFAVHPVHTEAVAGVVGRAEVLAAVCFFMAILAFLGAKPTWTQAPLCVLLSAAAMLFKEQGVTAILACASLDVAALVAGKRPLPPARVGATLLRVLVLACGGAALLAARLRVAGESLAVPFSEQNNPAAYASEWSTRALTYHYLLPVNLGKLLWPSRGNLCCDWSRGSIPLVTSLADPRNIGTAAFWSAALGLVAALARALLFAETRDDRRAALPGAAVLALTVLPFLPASNLILPVGFVVAERVLYIPSAGFCLGVALVAVDDHFASVAASAYSRGARHAALRAKPAAFLRAICLAGALVACGVTTGLRNRDWRSKAALWTSGVIANPRNAMLHYNLGHELEDLGEAAAPPEERRALLGQAFRSFGRAAELDPAAAEARLMQGIMSLKANQPEAAVSLLKDAVSRKPSATAHHNLAIALLALESKEKGRGQGGDTGQDLFGEAVVHLRAAIDSDSRFHASHELLGSVLKEMGRPAEALESLAAAFRLEPSTRLLGDLQELSRSSWKSEIAADLGGAPGGDEGGGLSLEACERLAAVWDVDGANGCFDALMVAEAEALGGAPSSGALGAFGRFLAATGRFHDAQQLLDAAVRKPSGDVRRDVETLVLACNVRRERGLVGEAKACLEAAARKTNHPAVHHNHGVLLAELGRVDESNAAFARSGR